MSENKKRRGLFGRPQQSAGQRAEEPRQEQQHAPRPKKKGRAGKIIGTIVLVMVLTAVIFTGIFLTWINTSLKGKTEVYLDELETKVSTELYYQDAKTDEWVMYQTLYSEGENRIWIDLENIPDYMKDAAIAIEDKRFEKHNGVDFRGTVRAILSTLTGRGVQGGSTITQQLIKNVTGDNQSTVKRKVTEIYRALELEKRYSKDQILESYLNRICLGQSCYGVEAAARTYFGKSASELTLAQSASLIGITNNPSQFGPFEGEWSREQNRERELLILDAMLDQGKITQAEYDAAKAEEVIFTNGWSNTGNYYGDEDTSALLEETEPVVAQYTSRNSYFTDALIEDVIQALMGEFGYDYDTAQNALFNKGYKIYTTQNYEYQKIAESVFTDLSNTPYTRTNSKGETEQLQGAITIIDPYTGYIVAMVGGTGQKTADRGWNWATSVRPCGSAAKPISTYAPALDQGIITGASTIVRRQRSSQGCSHTSAQAVGKGLSLRIIFTASARRPSSASAM
jgi:penicillin-binding protein 1A